MAIYIEKMGGLERPPDDVRFVPNLNINTKNLHFLCFRSLTCTHRIVPAFACLELSWL